MLLMHLLCSLTKISIPYVKDIHVFTQAHIVYFYLLGSEYCFPSNSKLKLENRKIVTMSELQEGDKVQTGKK